MHDEGISEALELFCEAMENAVQVLKQALADSEGTSSSWVE